VRDTTKRDVFEKMQATARPPYGAITRPLDPARFDGRHIVELPYKANGQGFLANPREKPVARAAQIWIRSLDGTPKRKLTDVHYSHRNVTVSPDGQWVAFTADPELRPDSTVRARRDSIARLPYDAKRDEAARNDADIFVVAIGGGTPRRITRVSGDEGNLEWSPDSRRIAFVSRRERTENARLYVVDAAGGEPANLVGEWQFEPSNHWWLPSGEIAVSAEVGGRTALFALSPTAAGSKTPALREVLGGRRRVSGWSIDPSGKVAAYVATSTTRPTELFVAGVDGSNERQLTRFNE
jgi:Tol biopolymer transport system component